MYSWSGAGNADMATTPVVPGLAAGTYTVTVTDANLCDQVITEVILEDPDAISVLIQDSTMVSCFGDTLNCDGQATAFASGGGAGTGVYNFQWFNYYFIP